MQENNNNSEGKEIEFDVLTEIGNIGAGNATTALSQLIEGDVDGMMLFVLESSAAHLLVDQLMGCVSGENKGDFSEMEQSALMEIGNIIAGAYLSSISELTNMKITSSVPY